MAFDALRRRGPLEDVDLESQRLLPTQRFTTQDLRRDAAIFEEDQLARAQIEREEKLTAHKPKQYLNEDGYVQFLVSYLFEADQGVFGSFFTQTKPATQLRSTYMAPPSPTPPPMTPTQVEKPELSELDEIPSPDKAGPLRRVKRGHREASPEAMSAPVTAFDLMMKRTSVKDPAKAKDDKVKRKQIKDTFLEGEAAESDEDVVFGFGGAKEDEKEDDEEQDKPLEGLVDDQQMSDNILNENAVLEKHAYVHVHRSMPENSSTTNL